MASESERESAPAEGAPLAGAAESEVTTGHASARIKPAPPDTAEDFDPEQLRRSRPNQYDAVLTLTRPARGRTTVLGGALLGTCAVENQMGTREPKKALVSFSRDRRWCYLMPVHAKQNKAVKISYRHGQAHLNLWGAFQEKGRIVEKGYREYYRLEMTEEPVVIHGVVGYALYFSLAEYDKETLSKREESEEEGALEELQALLESREAELEAAKARLKLYEERFGKL